MKKFVIAGTLVGALAVGGTAFAQSPTPAAQQPAAGARSRRPNRSLRRRSRPGRQRISRPRKKKTTTKKAAPIRGRTHTAPKAQPNTTDDATAPGTAMALGTVHLPKGVKADGKDLPAGIYRSV